MQRIKRIDIPGYPLEVKVLQEIIKELEDKKTILERDVEILERRQRDVLEFLSKHQTSPIRPFGPMQIQVRQGPDGQHYAFLPENIARERTSEEIVREITNMVYRNADDTIGSHDDAFMTELFRRRFMSASGGQ